MGKLLRIRDYALIVAAVGGEIIEEIRLVGGYLPAVMQSQYGFVPARYKRISYLSAVSRMLSTGEISRRVNKNGRVYLELSSSGKSEFKRRFPLLSLQGKNWDEVFMIVIFDIPEKQKRVREELRAKLSGLGFGMLQESVFISPYHFEEDLREYLEWNRLGDYVFVLRALGLWVGDIKEMAQKVWGLRRINKGYRQVLSLLRQAKRDPGKKKGLIRRAYTLYIDTLAGDPLLPKELLPEYWKRENALNLLSRSIRAL